MFKSLFGSINKSIVVIVVATILLAVATFFEREYGAGMTKVVIYHSWYLWLLIIFGLLTLIYQILVARKLTFQRIHSILLHSAFLFIVAGAMVTHFFSQEAFLMVREGKQSNIMLNAQQMPIGELPFSIKLNTFTVERYGGTGMPSNYISDITIIDGETAQDFRVAMNKIARYRGYKFYQSSYDGDELGTVLLLNNDYWGSLISYIGYALLMLGMGLIFFNRRSRFGTLLKKLSIIVILCTTTLTAEAQITQDNIKALSTIPVQAANGRIEPFSTFANNIVQKLYKDQSYYGIKSEFIVMDMLAGNPKWQTEPIIKLASESVQNHLDKESIYVTYLEFFTSDGQYLLKDIMNVIYTTKQEQLSRTDKELLKLDERIHIIYQLYNHMLPIVIPDSNTKWHSLAESKAHKQSLLTSEFDNIIQLFGNNTGGEVLNEAITLFKLNQRENTALEHRVSPTRLSCEAWYNNINLVFFTAILVIVMGFMGIITFLMGFVAAKPIVSAFEKIVNTGVLLGIIALTFNIALRWYIAERVPMSNSYETVLCVAWTLLLGGWLFRRISILVVSSIAFVAGFFLMISYVGGLDPQITPLVPILNSHWLLFHVATIAVSYGLFALSTVMGIIYMLIRAIAPNKPNMITISSKLTALNELSQLVAVIFLTIGIFLGAIWANVSWGRYWGWDPKETWALITMLAYVVNIHLFLSKKLYSEYLINLLSIFCIGLVLMTFFGVNYFFGGMHSYGGEYQFPLMGCLSIVIVLIILVVTTKIRINRCKTDMEKEKQERRQS